MRIAVARETDPAEHAGRRDARNRQEDQSARRRGGGRARRRRSSPAFPTPITPLPVRRSPTTPSSDADVVLKVRRPTPIELASYKRGALVIAIMDPYGNEAALKAMAEPASPPSPWN